MIVLTLGVTDASIGTSVSGEGIP